MSMYWPIALIVFSNIVYHICSKQTPAEVNPLASLTVSYLVGAVVSGVLYCLLNRSGSLAAEYRHLNWTSIALGVAIVGLEAGSLYMYKVGWNVNTGQLVHSAILAVALVFVGAALYGEAITPNKLIGVGLCLAGIVFMNR